MTSVSKSFELRFEGNEREIIRLAIEALLDTVTDPRKVFNETHKSIPLLEIYRATKSSATITADDWQISLMVEALENLRMTVHGRKKEPWHADPLLKCLKKLVTI